MLQKLTSLFFACLLLCGCQQHIMKPLPPRDTRAEGFVYLDGNHFALDGQPWFPLMLNYKVDWRQIADTACISPAFYYDDAYAWDYNTAHGTTQQLRSHFGMIRQMGFNCVRICIDVMNRNEQGYFYGSKEDPLYLIADSTAILNALDTLLQQADGLRVMLLLKPPFDPELEAFTQATLRHFAHCTTLFAYDFMNEPLYFDAELQHDKLTAYSRVCGWREMMDRYAPHQLFTIGFAEPIEVFAWDPAMMHVDFVEMHTYHPLRVANEMYWYGHYCGKPWIVGETALPADGDSVPYHWQRRFMQESFQCAIDNGACGYGWWEFQDCLQGVNFEAQYTGLFFHADTLGAKEATQQVALLNALPQQSPTRPINYFNMLGYENLVLHGKVVDAHTGHPIAGAVIRGWNDDWSVGVNTYSADDGTFRLYSNDSCTHFTISAPKYSTAKFDQRMAYTNAEGEAIVAEVLPNKEREYQSIDYRSYLNNSDSSLLTFKEGLWHNATVGTANMGTIELRRLMH